MTIYLYHKHCSHCDLKYFGRTIKTDPYKYLGSGKKWKCHIKIHGKERVVTDWVIPFEDQDDCTEYALTFSRYHDIVESSDYANLCLEDGLHHGTLGISEETKQKISQSKIRFHQGKTSVELHKSQPSLLR